MGKFLYQIIRAARPRQWLKNLAVYVTILFTGQLFVPNLFLITTFGFIAFCLLSSSNYIFNDVLDVSHDRKHPFKKFRPVASGKLSVHAALTVSAIFVITGLLLSRFISPAFLIIAITFIVIQYSYTLFLKHMTVIDILTITTGYLLRVYAGEAATGYHISIWLALAAVSLALFLAIGKRRAELTLLQGFKGIVPKDTRESLTHYSEKLLDTYTAMFANSTFLSYAFFTFFERPTVHGFFFHNYSDFIGGIPDRKWMMVTIPFVLYGIMRYMQLIYEGKGESPEKVLTSDLPLLATVILWGAMVIFVVYGIGG